MAFAEKDEHVEVLALDGPDEALGVSVQVGTARRQADRMTPAEARRARNWDV
jgi:hypothetical protein